MLARLMHIFALLFIFSHFSVSAQQADTLKVGVVNYNYYPYHIINDKRELDGIFISYAQEVARLNDLTLEYKVYESFELVLNALQLGAIDLVVGVHKSKAREQNVLFSTKIMSAPRGILVSTQRPSINLEQVKTLKWGCVKGSAYCDYLNEMGAKHIQQFLNPELAFSNVSNAQVDAFLGDYAALSYQQSNRYRPELTLISPLWLDNVNLFVGVKKGNFSLLNKINFALSNIPPQQREHYLKEAGDNYNAALAYDEFKHNYAKLKVDNDEPVYITYSFNDGYFPLHREREDGQVEGYIKDIFDLLKSRGGIQFKYIPTKNQREATSLLEAGKLDVIPTTSPMFLEQGVLLPLDDKFKLDFVQVTNQSNKGNSQHVGYLSLFSDPKTKSMSPLFNRSTAYNTPVELLNALKKHDIDAAVLPRSIAVFQLNNNYVGQFLLTANIVFSEKLYLVINSKQPEFTSLLSSLFKTITDNELANMHKKHALLNINSGYDKATINTTFVLILIFTLTSIVYFISWRVTITKEVAKRKKAEKQAIDKLSFTQKLIDDIPTMIVIQDKSHKRVMWNNAYKNTFRHLWDEQEEYLLVKLPIVKLITEQNDTILKTGKSIIRDSEFTDVNGNVRQLAYTKKRYYDINGNPSGIMTVMTDISQFHEVQKQAQSAQLFLQTITDTIPGGVCQFEYYYNGEGRYTYVSKGAKCILGLTEDYINQVGVVGCISPYIVDEDRVHIAKTFKSSSDDGSPIDIEFRVNNIQGEVWCRFIANPEIEGARERLNIIRWNGILLDITQLKEQKSALKQATDVANQAVHARGRLLATMGNELRVPITGVAGLLELLNRSEMNDEQQFILNNVDDSLNSLLFLVNDILDFSKIEVGQLTLENKAVEIDVLICSVLRSHVVNAQNKGLNVHLNWQPSYSNMASFDPLRVGQILTNLLSNAIKFTSYGIINIDVKVGCSVIEITIKDTGIGMNKAQLACLFSPLEDAGPSTLRRFSGKGLGMNIVKQIVDAMEAEIDITSEENIGTQVKLRLPMSEYIQNVKVSSKLRWFIYEEFDYLESLLNKWQVDYSLRLADNLETDLNCHYAIIIKEVMLASVFGADWQGRIKQSNSSVIVLTENKEVISRLHSNVIMISTMPLYPDILRQSINDINLAIKPKTFHRAANSLSLLKGNVLIVEDNQVNQLLLQNQLEKLGLNISVAENGNHAFEILKSNDFDIIITDCHMPEMDGFEFTRLIRSNSQYSDLPIIGMTADNSKEKREKADAAGMNWLLFKPYPLEQLHSKLSVHLRLTPRSTSPHQLVGSFDNELSCEFDNADLAHWICVFGNKEDAYTMAQVFIDVLTKDLSKLGDEKLSVAAISPILHHIKGSLVMVKFNSAVEQLNYCEELIKDHDSNIEQTLDKLIIMLNKLIDNTKLWLY